MNVVDPSDNIVTKEYKLKPFERIQMKGVGNVELIQSEEKSGLVELTAPDNYVEFYEFESNGTKLTINFDKKLVNIQTKDVKIRVYTCDLIKLENSGAANINMDRLDTDIIEITNSGVGHIKIGGVADNVQLINSGVGSIDASKLKALNVKASVSGVGSIDCYASESIKGSVSGVGSLNYNGHPKHKDTKRSGVGSINEL
jgi:hypothetical protein